MSASKRLLRRASSSNCVSYAGTSLNGTTTPPRCSRRQTAGRTFVCPRLCDDGYRKRMQRRSSSSTPFVTGSFESGRRVPRVGVSRAAMLGAVPKHLAHGARPCSSGAAERLGREATEHLDHVRGSVAV